MVNLTTWDEFGAEVLRLFHAALWPSSVLYDSTDSNKITLVVSIDPKTPGGPAIGHKVGKVQLTAFSIEIDTPDELTCILVFDLLGGVTIEDDDTPQTLWERLFPEAK